MLILFYLYNKLISILVFPYNALCRPYYMDADAAILAYSVNDQTSFDNVDKWVKQINQYVEETVIMLWGNKSDLDKTVTLISGREKADTLGALFIEISAKEGTNVEDMFCSIIREIRSRNTKDDY